MRKPEDQQDVVNPPTTDYPNASLKNSTPDNPNSGSAILAYAVNDLFGFTAALIKKANQTNGSFNGNPETANNSEVCDAIVKIVNDAVEVEKVNSVSLFAPKINPIVTNLKVNGDTTVDDLQVNGDTTVKDLQVNGDATVDDNLQVNGDATVDDLQVNGNLRVNGYTSVGNLQAKGYISVLDSLDVHGHISARDILSVKDLNVYGDATVNNHQVTTNNSSDIGYTTIAFSRVFFPAFSKTYCIITHLYPNGEMRIRKHSDSLDDFNNEAFVYKIRTCIGKVFIKNTNGDDGLYDSYLIELCKKNPQ